MELYLLSINAVLEGVKTFSQTFNERKVNNTMGNWNLIGNEVFLIFAFTFPHLF